MPALLASAQQAWIAPDSQLLATARHRTDQPFPDSSVACPPSCRPRLLGVLDSRDIKISGVTLTDPVYWALHVWRGVRVVIDGVTIHGDRGIPNNDGGCEQGVLKWGDCSSCRSCRSCCGAQSS